jgi:DMSO reductase anchor subunit
MIFGESLDERADPAEPGRHGRFIDSNVGTLDGEAAQQKTKQTIDVSLRTASEKLPGAFASAPDGPTYYDQPVLQTPVWIWTVPLYFYLGGTAGGALALGAAAQAADGRKLKGLIARCHWLGVGGLSLGSACLIYDLGRPMRFLNMFRVFRPSSPLSVGSWLLAAATPVAGVAALLSSVPGLRRYGHLAGYAAGVMGLPLAGYTGVVLADTAIPAWQEARRMLPVMFIGSAVAGTASILEIMDLSAREERAARLFGVIGKTVELGGMFAIEREAGRIAHVCVPYHRRRSGFLWKAAKALSLASLVLSVVPGKSKRKHVVAGVLGTFGAITNRFAMIEVGKASAADPRATFRMQREGHGAAQVTESESEQPRTLTGAAG